jgi:diadenosine tetraphosphate (Ap4A) HIT family hydrolase|tara:strand:- start:1191 stop:1550 length:360 start_codon:yes stop_codon:yes gene_type:complete
MKSPFLNIEKIIENENAFAIYDAFPVSKGHVLVIPKRVIAEIFDLNDEEYSSCFNLVKEVKKILEEKFKPDGFNIGINNGEKAGQTIFHAHIHVIPRYSGDVDNPRGGIRHVIPGKGDY